jgi:hypothetical protein
MGGAHSADLERAYAEGGLEGLLREKVRLYEANTVSVTYGLAELHSHLGERELALDWIERAYAERNFFLLYMKVNPAFHTLRREPRFQEVERLVGL